MELEKQILKSILESQLSIEKVVLKEATGHYKLDNDFLHGTIHITIMKIKEIERQLRKLKKLMRVIKKNVYYCDFCSKKWLKSIQEHENHCTANPKRWCRLCENSVELTKFIEKYKERFTLHKNDADWSKLAHGEQPDEFKVEWTGEPITLEELEKEFDNCPCCVLSILRQTGMNKHYFHFEYDYKGLSKKYLDEKTRDQSYY